MAGVHGTLYGRSASTCHVRSKRNRPSRTQLARLPTRRRWYASRRMPRSSWRRCPRRVSRASSRRSPPTRTGWQSASARPVRRSPMLCACRGRAFTFTPESTRCAEGRCGALRMTAPGRSGALRMTAPGCSVTLRMTAPEPIGGLGLLRWPHAAGCRSGAAAGGRRACASSERRINRQQVI